MAEPTIALAYPTTAWAAETSVTVTNPDSYHQHAFGIYSATASVKVQWSVDNSNWADAAATAATATSDTLYVNHPAPYMRLTSTAAFSGFHMALNTQASTRSE